MIRSNPEIAALQWQVIVDELAKILDADADTLERNIEYYQRIREVPNTDPKKLHNIYNKLIREQNRFFYFTEVYFRLQNPSLVNMMNGIEQVFKKQKALTGKDDEDFVIYFRKCEQNSQVFYMPL